MIVIIYVLLLLHSINLILGIIWCRTQAVATFARGAGESTGEIS